MMLFSMVVSPRGSVGGDGGLRVIDPDHRATGKSSVPGTRAQGTRMLQQQAFP
jgi:hypothetical protein